MIEAVYMVNYIAKIVLVLGVFTTINLFAIGLLGYLLNKLLNEYTKHYKTHEERINELERKNRKS